MNVLILIAICSLFAMGSFYCTYKILDATKESHEQSVQVDNIASQNIITNNK